jgi:hypothetical protein
MKPEQMPSLQLRYPAQRTPQTPRKRPRVHSPSGYSLTQICGPRRELIELQGFIEGTLDGREHQIQMTAPER